MFAAERVRLLRPLRIGESLRRETELADLSVKSGGVQVRDVRDLVGVLEREKAEIGVLITLEEPSKPMKKEAADAGFFKRRQGIEQTFPTIAARKFSERTKQVMRLMMATRQG